MIYLAVATPVARLSDVQPLCPRLWRRPGVSLRSSLSASRHARHLLVRVPDREAMPRLTRETLLELLPILYDASQRLGIEQEIERAAASDDPAWLAGILERFESRRFDLANFVKDLKQRFCRSAIGFGV